MAGLVRANQSYWAGNQFVQEGSVLAEGDPKIVEGYVEEFKVPEAPATPEPKAKGKPKE
jgi:hypothetical protein